MESLNSFNKDIKYIFCDIDDTLTNQGRLSSESYEALWKLHKAGKKIIPVTGRPAGWCEMIARMWPVEAVVGENGGFYFYYKNKSMNRCYMISEEEMKLNQKKLYKIRDEILKEVPEAAVASDQFCRQMDLAIDFCEDVKPLSENKIGLIFDIFKKHGAAAKISSIHINGWFGEYDKLSTCKKYFKDQVGKDLSKCQDEVSFIGDSPNDEPMFAFFENSVGVANIKKFEKSLQTPPRFLTDSESSCGFVEFAEKILNNKLG